MIKSRNTLNNLHHIPRASSGKVIGMHSEEVMDIITRPPSVIVRSGITVVAFVIVFVLLACWFIKYPDIVQAGITLGMQESPRVIHFRDDGKIEKLLVSDGRIVDKGQHLAYLESSGDHQEVLALESQAVRIREAIEKDDWKSVEKFSIISYNNLGELQPNIRQFSEIFYRYKEFASGGMFHKKRQILLDDQLTLKLIESKNAEHFQLLSTTYEIAKTDYEIQEKLYKNKAISLVEFKREQMKLLNQEAPLKNLSSSLLQNRYAQNSKKQEILTLEASLLENRSLLSQSTQNLLAAIQEWKLKYIVKAYVTGRISFASPWLDQQFFSARDEFVTIEPLVNGYQGFINIQQANFGKLQVGQEVYVKLDGYPFAEFGVVKGKLTKMSMTTRKDSTYWGYVSLPNGLMTTHGKVLPFRSGLRGKAEIVTRDRRIVDRLMAGIVGNR